MINTFVGLLKCMKVHKQPITVTYNLIFVKAVWKFPGKDTEVSAQLPVPGSGKL
jgi:hypothetical protein